MNNALIFKLMKNYSAADLGIDPSKVVDVEGTWMPKPKLLSGPKISPNYFKIGNGILIGAQIGHDGGLWAAENGYLGKSAQDWVKPEGKGEQVGAALYEKLNGKFEPRDDIKLKPSKNSMDASTKATLWGLGLLGAGALAYKLYKNNKNKEVG